MKKMCLVLVLILILFCFVGCDPGTFYFNAEEILSRVIKIELVECINDNPQSIAVSKDTTPAFDFNEVTVLKELRTDRIERFVRELSVVTFHLGDQSVNMPLGYAVLIYLQGNEMVVLSYTYLFNKSYGMVEVFTHEGKFVRHLAIYADVNGYTYLLAKYFNVINVEIR